jgi:uncharacterized protein (DUF58 family)
MTKYLIMENPPGSEQSNEPGSREEMACAIVKAAALHSYPQDKFIAFPVENPNASWAFLKDSVKYTVELDDARAEIWSKEIEPLLQNAERVHDAIWEAYSNIFDAAEEFDNACQNSRHFQDLTLSEDLALDSIFENIDNTSKFEISEKVDEIFEVENLQLR